jgi:hypothetical protein
MLGILNSLPSHLTEKPMTRPDPTQPLIPDSRLKREMERERNEHSINQGAKARLGSGEDERLKDARQTPHSSKVRR